MLPESITCQHKHTAQSTLEPAEADKIKAYESGGEFDKAQADKSSLICTNI